jgi:hypothetical protein
MLKTYNIDSDQTIDQVELSVSGGAAVKAVDYSNDTNLVFVNIEKTKNGTVSDSVYSIDIMKNTQKLSLGSIVDNMVLLGKTNSLYYNDEKSNLYLHAEPFAGLQKGKLIGRDEEDNVYVQSADDPGSVYKVSNEKLADTLALPDPNVIRFYADKKNVYAVYGNYIVNLSGDMQAKLEFDSHLQFLGFGGANAYLLEAGGPGGGRKPY